MQIGRHNMFLLLLYGFLIFVAAYMYPVEVDWSQSYDVNHTKPYGTKVLKTLLESDPNHWNIEMIEEPLFDVLRDDSVSQQPILLLNNTIQADTFELSMILDKVGVGQDVFIATDKIPDYLSDTLGFDFSRSFASISLPNIDSTYTATLRKDLKTDHYTFNRIRNFRSIITDGDSTKTFVGDTLGLYNDDLCFIRVPFQEGNFYIHSIPVLFTNYHMLKDDPSYALECMHYLSEKELLWEQYYLAHKNNQRSSPLHTILQMKSFKWALWLTLLGIGIFVLFRIKREQRAIPIVEPYKNRSKLFAETIGRLYYNRGDHRNLSLKSISHFKEYLHTQYYMKDIDFTHAEAKLLALKSGYEQDKINQLFNNINNIRSTKTVTDGMLTTLYKQLQNFYK